MTRKYKEWYSAKTEVICENCGKIVTLQKASVLKNKRDHKGRFLCKECSFEEYKKSENHLDLVDYVHWDRKDKLLKILRKKNIVLLNSPVDKNGYFPYATNRKKNLELKCNKCGFVWKESMIRCFDWGMNCPICYPEGRPNKYNATSINEKLKEKDIWVDPNTFDKYAGSKKKSHLKCLKCGHEWDDRVYYYLYTNKKCPKCKDKENE